MSRPLFLSLDEMLALHADQVRRYGGGVGVRDLELLKSALAMPSAGHRGDYLHSNLFEMAAAYLFHIVRNHPFVDGNKRAGLIAAVAFLGLNGLRIESDPDPLYELAMGVAEGEIGKAEIAVFLREHAVKRR